MSIAMPQRVDVRVPREQAGTLRPGPLSITDGRPAARTVAVRMWRIPTVALPVDEQTARQLERLRRRRSRIVRYVAPTLIILAAALAALGIVALLNGDGKLWFPAQSALTLVMISSVLVNAFNRIGVPRQHPIIRGQHVLVRDVDPVAAAAWADANPSAGMELAVRR